MRRLGLTVALAAALGLGAVTSATAAPSSPAEAAACSTSARPADAAGNPINLTGVWSANDGGTYWIRQLGNCVWWAGFSGPVDSADMGKSFSNVFSGRIATSSTVVGSWVDVPRGETANSGTLSLGFRLDPARKAGRLYRIRSTGGFGATVWTLVQAA